MIEQGIYFALGCIVTAILALAFAPFFWRRALRLTRRRLQLQVPLSMQEILAERDQLRAEFAVERLRIEQAMEKVRATKARDMAEIGRSRAAATALVEEVAALRRIEEAQEKEIDALLRDVAAAGADNGSLKVELHDAHVRLDRWKHAGELAVAEHQRVQDQAESHRTTIASLETRAMGLEMRLTDAGRAAEVRENGLRSRLEAAMAQSARHEASGLLVRRELDEAKARIRALEHDLEAAPAAGGGPQQTIRRTAEAQPGRRSDEDEAADGGLRASIHALGLAVANMTRAARSADAVAVSSARGRRLKDEAPTPIDAG